MLNKFIIFPIIMSLLSVNPTSTQKTGSMIISLINSTSKTPITNAKVIFINPSFNKYLFRKGKYYIKNIPASKYSIKASGTFYHGQEVKNVIVKPKSNKQVTIILVNYPHESPPGKENIVALFISPQE